MREKRLRRIKQNPRNVSFDDLKTALEDYGFEMRPSKGTSHHFFRAEIQTQVWTLTIPYKKPHVNVTYVKAALKAIDEIQELQLSLDDDVDTDEDQEDSDDE
jgi:hypothetical protein